jgi:hypothetical protein
LYSSSNINVIKSRRMRWEGHVLHMGESRNAYNVLMERPEGKRPLGRLRCGWEDGIKMDLQDICWEGMDFTDLAEAREKCWAVVNTVMNF